MLREWLSTSKPIGYRRYSLTVTPTGADIPYNFYTDMEGLVEVQCRRVGWLSAPNHADAEAPVVECSCGFYLFRRPRIYSWPSNIYAAVDGGQWIAYSKVVLARVYFQVNAVCEMGGRIIEHDGYYRAETFNMLAVLIPRRIFYAPIGAREFHSLGCNIPSSNIRAEGGLQVFVDGSPRERREYLINIVEQATGLPVFVRNMRRYEERRNR